MVRGRVQQQPGQYLALVEEARRDKEAAERSLAERASRFRAELAQSDNWPGCDTRDAPSTERIGVVVLAHDRTTAGRLGSTALVPWPLWHALIRPDRRAARQRRGHRPSRGRLATRNGGRLPALHTVATTTASAHRLAGARPRQRIWDPVAVHMHGVSKVFVVPDRQLHLVPLAALPTGSADYLLEQARRHPLHVVRARRRLRPRRLRARDRVLFALGGPAFGDDAILAGPGIPAANDGKPARRCRRRGCGTLQALHFQPLPGSHREQPKSSLSGTSSGHETREPAPAANRRGRKRTGVQAICTGTSGAASRHEMALFLGDACSPWAGNTRSVGGLPPL